MHLLSCKDLQVRLAFKKLKLKQTEDVKVVFHRRLLSKDSISSIDNNEYLEYETKKTKMSLRMWINENVCPTAPYYLFVRVILFNCKQ